MVEEVPKEVEEFLKGLEKPLKEAKEALKKAQAFIKLGKEMGFDVTEQEKRQRELEEKIRKIEEVKARYLAKK